MNIKEKYDKMMFNNPSQSKLLKIIEKLLKMNKDKDFLDKDRNLFLKKLMKGKMGIGLLLNDKNKDLEKMTIQIKNGPKEMNFSFKNKDLKELEKLAKTGKEKDLIKLIPFINSLSGKNLDISEIKKLLKEEGSLDSTKINKQKNKNLDEYNMPDPGHKGLK